jgi:hypothetical protein
MEMIVVRLNIVFDRSIVVDITKGKEMSSIIIIKLINYDSLKSFHPETAFSSPMLYVHVLAS